MTRKIFIALLLVMWASCALASVTPQQALSDSRIGPFVDFTKKNGSGLLPGRYAHTKELNQRTGGEKILAPTNLIVEIAPMAKLNPQQITYSVNADLWGADEMASMYMVLDFSGAVPILKTYASDESGNYETIAEDFAVVLSDGKKRLWCLGSVETGEIRYMYPLDEQYFPEGWYKGSWKGKSGISYSFSDNGQVKINGQAAGKFIVSDNRIVITRNNGSKEVIYAQLNSEADNLVMTFTGQDEFVTEIFSRVKETSSESKLPPFLQPKPKQKTQTQEMPSEFPKMPDVQMPKPPAVNIEGVWGAYVNNQQWITQFKGNQYFGWINGQPSEMGIIQIEGNVITGKNNHGTEFTATLELDASGKTLTMTFQNGNAIVYQRLQ